MNLYGLWLNFSAQMRLLAPVFFGMLGLLLAGSALLLVLARNVTLEQRRFRVLGLFFSLSRRGALCMIASVLRLFFLIACVALFRQLEAVHYGVFLLLGALYLACAGSVGNIVSGSINLVLEFVGTVTINLLCGYLLSRRFDMMYFVLYLLMAFFLLLFAVYIFLQEIDGISAERRMQYAAAEQDDAEQ